MPNRKFSAELHRQFSTNGNGTKDGIRHGFLRNAAISVGTEIGIQIVHIRHIWTSERSDDYRNSRLLQAGNQLPVRRINRDLPLVHAHADEERTDDVVRRSRFFQDALDVILIYRFVNELRLYVTMDSGN